MSQQQGVTLRAAQPEDAAALSALAFESKAHWGYGAEFMQACRDELTVKVADILGRDVVVAEADGRVLGYGYLMPREGGGIEIWHLFVAPQAMGRGAGRRITDALIEQARAAGEARLWVEADPNALGFYQACGFRLVGEAPSASIGGRRLPLLVMEL